jgi:LPXTG-motif cell wall-anchored protein
MLATTGANVELLLVAGLLAVIAGSGFIAFSRRKRIT